MWRSENLYLESAKLLLSLVNYWINNENAEGIGAQIYRYTIIFHTSHYFKKSLLWSVKQCTHIIKMEIKGYTISSGENTSVFWNEEGAFLSL